MGRFWDKSIRFKLTAVIMVIAAVTLQLAFLIFAILDMLMFRDEMVNDLSSVVEIVGANSTAALAFNDSQAAAETLASLRDRPHIMAACLYDQAGSVFSEYLRTDSRSPVTWPDPAPPGHQFASKFLEVFGPVTLEGESLGVVYVKADMDFVYARLRSRAKIVGLVLLMSMGVAFGLTSKLQKVISGPILQLAATAHLVSENKDYSVRASKHSSDEVGTLIGAFNEMLGEIQQRDEKLGSSEKHFRSLIEHATDIITVLDTQGRIQYASPSVSRILGIDVSALMGQTLTEFIHPEDQEEALALLAPAEESSTEIRMAEYRFGTNGGGQVVLDSVARDLCHDPAVRGVVVNSRDITDRKAAAAKLTALVERLETSNRELQNFAFVASHDLQEPLRKIRAFGDRLRVKCGDSLSEQGLDYVERMLNAAGRMQNLIVSLLDFSRVTSKAQAFVPVDLDETARGVLGDLEVRIEQIGAEVELSDLPTIDADPTQMRQLLQNLIGNALKFYHEERAPVVRVTCHPENGSAVKALGPNNRRCQIRVEDNGIGFDEKYQDRIFGIFQRLHGRNQYEGTGVGLSICRKIAERHGGNISVTSTPGSGATFIVTLPIHQDQGGLVA